MDIKESDILGRDIEHHWYYKTKLAALLNILDGQRFHTLLDIGAGSGFFARALINAGVAEQAICVDLAYERDWEEQIDEKSIAFRRTVQSCQADLIIFMDVLEHVEDDTALLDEYTPHLTPDGKVLVSVPAFQWLFSSHDRFLEHHRRYAKSNLTAAIQSAQLNPIQIHFFFATLFPVVAFKRLIDKLLLRHPASVKSDLKRHHPITNRLLHWIHRLELPLLKYNKLFGLTLFCMAEPTNPHSLLTEE